MQKADQRWRELIAQRCGGANFDAPGGGYSFSAVLAEESELMKKNIPGDPTSALLPFSVADPRWKMNWDALKASERFFDLDPNATRYTDLRGVGPCPEIGLLENTHELLSTYLNANYFGGDTFITPDWVQYSPGAIKRMLSEYIPALFFEPASIVYFPSPGYGVIENEINTRKARVINVPLLVNDGRWSFNLEFIARDRNSLENKNFPAYMYVNMPHNPTGTGMSKDEHQSLIEWAVSNNIVLIYDEAYVDLIYNPESVGVLSVPGWEQCCLVLQSVSKGWSATGLRFGWVVAHPTVIKAIRKVMDVKDSGSSALTIVQASICLLHPEWAQETRRRYKELHFDLNLALNSSGFQTLMPDAGLCQFVPAPRAINGVKFADVASCAKWIRENLRVSVMHATVHENPWLRFAVTLGPIPECSLPDEASVIAELIRRFNEAEFEF